MALLCRTHLPFRTRALTPISTPACVHHLSLCSQSDSRLHSGASWRDAVCLLSSARELVLRLHSRFSDTTRPRWQQLLRAGSSASCPTLYDLCLSLGVLMIFMDITARRREVFFEIQLASMHLSTGALLQERYRQLFSLPELLNSSSLYSARRIHVRVPTYLTKQSTFPSASYASDFWAMETCHSVNGSPVISHSTTNSSVLSLVRKRDSFLQDACTIRI